MGIDEINPKRILNRPQDLTSYTPSSEVSFALHDGSNTQTAGLYWRDRDNARWVKVSTEPPSSSVTIGLF